MVKHGSRQLVVLGLIIVVIAGLLTFVACGSSSNSMRRSAALFLEAVCPAGRMEGWTRISAWHVLFSGLLWLWALGLGSVIAGGALAWLSWGNQVAEAGADEEAGASPAQKSLMVGPESLGDGEAMTGEQLRDFERRLRRSIEQRPLEETEDMLRHAIARLRTPVLLEAISQPQGDIVIENWDGIYADMMAARDRLPVEQRDEPWRSVILALVYRNDYADILITPSFALSAEMDRSFFERRSGLMSDDQHRQWLAANRDLATLPPNPHYRAYLKRKPTRLTGLERLRAVHDWTSEGEDWKRLSAALQTVRMLAAAIVLLRFCQAAEQYLADPGLPGGLPAFLTVDMASWPMETNTIDYCIHAVRPVECAG